MLRGDQKAEIGECSTIYMTIPGFTYKNSLYSLCFLSPLSKKIPKRASKTTPECSYI